MFTNPRRQAAEISMRKERSKMPGSMKPKKTKEPGKLFAERIDIAISDKTGNFLHRYAALEKNTGLLHFLPGAVPCRRDAGLFFKYFSKRLITDLE